jgi:hypothetical protein
MRSKFGITQGIWVCLEPVLTESDIQGTSAFWDCGSEFGVEEASVVLHFTKTGQSRLQSWSRENVKHMLAIFISATNLSFHIPPRVVRWHVGRHPAKEIWFAFFDKRTNALGHVSAGTEFSRHRDIDGSNPLWIEFRGESPKHLTG